MTNFKKMKAGFLAAASVMAATAALSPAGAADIDPVAAPVTIAVEAPVAHAVDHADQDKAPMSAKKWALLAAAAGALAGLVKLIGARKVADAVAEGAIRTARIAASTASGAARAVGRTVSSPLRFLAALFGLALFALAGIGLYDVEWLGGLVSGALLAGATLFGMWKTRLALRPAKVKAKPAPVNANEN